MTQLTKIRMVMAFLKETHKKSNSKNRYLNIDHLEKMEMDEHHPSIEPDSRALKMNKAWEMETG